MQVYSAQGMKDVCQTSSTIADSLKAVLRRAAEQQQKRILVTGVFDGLHQEHVNFLRKAKALGGYLFVGLESDKRVSQIKGPGRPRVKQHQRLKAIRDRGLADSVFILPEHFSSTMDHEAFIREVRPNILAVSASTPHLEEKRKIVEAAGGVVQVIHDHNPEVSTTQILAEQKKDPKAPAAPLRDI